MSNRKRSTNELREASDRVFYEFWMFQQLAAVMVSGITREVVINNAILESFAIHVRVLIYFFYSEKPQRDDVVAEDFFSNSEEWIRIRPEITVLLRTAKRRADKEVAHLTYTRNKVTPEQKPWNIVEITEHLRDVVSAFIASVPHEVLGDRWKDTIA